jgi:hypothetical protein
MLSKIQTDTRLSGRLLDQGTRLGRATNRVSSNLCALHSTSLAYHACSFLSRAKRSIFNRLQRFDSLPRCLANFLRISNFSSSVNLTLHFPRSNRPIPSSLSEVARNHKAIRQEQNRASTDSFAQRKTQNNQTTHRAAEHSAPQLPAVGAYASGLLQQ